MSANLRCRWGFHAWRFVSMSDLRRLAPNTGWVCTRIDKCQRCHLKRTRFGASPPTSHVRTFRSRAATEGGK